MPAPAPVRGAPPPVLLAGSARRHGAPSDSPLRARSRTDFILLWCARLLVQVAGNVLFGFLFYYFQTLRDAPTQAGVARLSALALLVAFPIALGSGALSDRLGRRKPFLVVSACVAAAGLGLMTSAVEFLPSAIGYGLFGCASAVFLSLHSSFAMQFLPSPARRGRDLGVLNLTNTLPATIAPQLAIWLVPGRGFEALLALLAALMRSQACAPSACAMMYKRLATSNRNRQKASDNVHKRRGLCFHASLCWPP